MEIREQYLDYERREAACWEDLAEARSWADAWERSADAHPQDLVVIEVETGKRWTYQELDRAADRVAQGVTGRVGVLIPNGGAFLATVLGCAKAGVEAVLLNTREPETVAYERAEQAGCRTVLTELEDGAWPGRVNRRETVTLDDPAVYIFTSGTTGLARAARFSHRRLIGAGVAWALRTEMRPDDRCYIPLPLYHGNGLAVAFSACVQAGAAAVTRDRFSVSAFLEDVRNFHCTAAVYVGELWRYLNRQPSDHDRDNPLRVIFGNGLPLDLWERTVERYGIERVVEHFGATEMPAGALTNWTGRPGACGYIPPDHPAAADVRLHDGELLLRVPGGQYRGYLDSSQDAARLWSDGELWWRSGDRLTRDEEGFFRFQERLGDSYRWKGENISPGDVEAALRTCGFEACVYGIRVPHNDGKAGMAAVLGERLPDPALLAQHLPAYAVPLLIRLCPELPATSTLKFTRAALAAEGWQVPCFVRSETYLPLTGDTRLAFERGKLKL
jgi:acyl-CoA synthetase (AMP-forming)/AMP-acid ligase II